jgi:hypothetical protein
LQLVRAKVLGELSIQKFLKSCHYKPFFCYFRFCTDKFGTVQLLCKNHLPFISFHGKAVPYCPSKYKLGCKEPAIQHYPYPVRGCNKTGIVAAYVNHVSSLSLTLKSKKKSIFYIFRSKHQVPITVW